MRVMCPKCGKLIDTDGTKPTIFCSECGNNFALEQGKKLFDRQYGAIANQAFLDLTQRGAYDHAIKLYKNCLEIKTNDLSSIVGIALATLYKQDFLNINFNKIKPIIDEYDIYLDEENTFLFLSFVEDVIKETRKFLREAKERLFKDGKCIAKKYLDSYLNGLKDIVDLYNYFDETFTICSEEEKKIFFSDHDLSVDINEIRSEANELMSKDYEILNPEEELEDNRIIIIDKKPLKIYRYVLSFELLMGVLLIVFLILGASLGDSIYYYLVIIPAGLAAIVYLLYYQLYLKKR